MIMPDMMTFPNTVEEFMEYYKITDTKQVYTNGAELVPIFRMKQWFEHKPERQPGKWIRKTFEDWWCNQCGNEICTETPENYYYCPCCGARMEVDADDT